MEPVMLRRQHQYAAYDAHASRKDEAAESDDLLSAPLAAVKLAERGDFPRLLVALALRPQLARAVDAFGMTALHWVCSDAQAPSRVVLTVALAHRPAAATRNLAGLLPLHLAIRKHLALEALQALLHVYPRAVAVPTPDGKTVLALAKQRPAASGAVLALLRVLDAHARTGAPAPLPLSPQWHSKPEEDGHHVEEPGESRISDRLSSSRHVVQEEAMATVTAPLEPPPRWALGTRCRLCAAKFGYFRQRHHCRRCGASVCGRHSRHRVPLKHLGLFQPQRVCACCFDDLQKQLNARALARVTRAGSAYPYIDNGNSITNFQATSNQFEQSQSRHRRRSKSVYSEPQQYHNPVEWADHHDSNGSYNGIGGFVPVPASRHRSVPDSDAGSSLQPTTGSMFLSVAPAQSTVLERQRQLRQKQQQQLNSQRQEQGAEANGRRSRQRRPRPHSSALDRTLNVQRLSGSNSGHSSEEQELEQRMQQLMAAKHELGEAVRRSEQEIARAEREKRELDAVADKYREGGYSSPQEDEDEDEEAENAATAAFLTSTRRMSSTADLLDDLEPPLDVAATHHQLGVTLLGKGDFVGAVSELQRSVELDDEDATAWLHLAKALDGVNENRVAAEEAVRRALALDPRSIGALSLLGKLLHLRGDHDDAILVFRQALELQCPAGSLASKSVLEGAEA